MFPSEKSASTWCENRNRAIICYMIPHMERFISSAVQVAFEGWVESFLQVLLQVPSTSPQELRAREGLAWEQGRV